MSPNIWSFVCADELQEAVLFPYLVDDVKEKQQERQQGAREVAGHGGAIKNGMISNAGTGGGLFVDNGQGGGNSEEDVEREARAAAVEVAAIVEEEGEEEELTLAIQPPPTQEGITNGRISTMVHETVEDTTTPSNNNGIVNNSNNEIFATDTALHSTHPPGAPHSAARLQHSQEPQPTTQEMFQAVILDRVQRGTISSSGRKTQLPWDKQSWPRCAWWVRGIGAFAVHGMSDAPVLTPFQPLGEFIGDLGRLPTDEECAIYVNRFRERGWQISPTLLSRLGCAPGGSSEEISEICRLRGLVSDCDMVGDIVWTYDTVAGIYWPAEIIDPLAPVPGKALPPSALNHLTPDQRKASLPCTDGTYNHLEESAANRRVLALFLPLPSQGAPQVWKVSSSEGKIK